MISHRFVVSGIAAGIEIVPVEVRCTVCGGTKTFEDEGYSPSLTELTIWAGKHECPRTLSVNTMEGPSLRGQRTNTTGRSTDRKTNGQPIVRNNVLVQADHVAMTQLFSRSPFEGDMTPLDTYVNDLVDDFRSKKPKEG
jgi:hypothetical protein